MSSAEPRPLLVLDGPPFGGRYPPPGSYLDVDVPLGVSVLWWGHRWRRPSWSDSPTAWQRTTIRRSTRAPCSSSSSSVRWTTTRSWPRPRGVGDRGCSVVSWRPRASPLPVGPSHRSIAPTHSTPTSSSPGIRRSRSGSTSSAPVMAAPSRPGGWWPARTARRSSRSACRSIANEPGDDWSNPVSIDAADPDGLDVWEEPDAEPVNGYFDMRPLNQPIGRYAPPPYWVRARNPVPEDDASRACLLTYLSDMGILAMALAPGASPIGSATSLDHSVWFHRPYRPEEWHLFSGGSRSNSGRRGLAIGELHHRDGTLVATIAQEGLFRPPRSMPEVEAADSHPRGVVPPVLVAEDTLEELAAVGAGQLVADLVAAGPLVAPRCASTWARSASRSRACPAWPGRPRAPTRPTRRRGSPNTAASRIAGSRRAPPRSRPGRCSCRRR